MANVIFMLVRNVPHTHRESTVEVRFRSSSIAMKSYFQKELTENIRETKSLAEVFVDKLMSRSPGSRSTLEFAILKNTYFEALLHVKGRRAK